MPPTNLDISDAYLFYKDYILDYAQGKTEIYERYGFTVQGGVGSKDWEVFAAILMKDKARGGVGADLQRHEVKSATGKGSFEYQYHKKYGLQKLEEEKTVDHVFIARSADYLNFSVWWVDKKDLTPFFDQWRPRLEANYQSGEKQRFRRSITASFVRSKGVLLMEVRDGKLVHPSAP